MSSFSSGADEINLSADILDSRDIDARIEWLESQKADAADPDLDDDIRPEPLTDDEAEELAALLALKEGLEGYCDWIHGETLVAESYKAEYARQYAEDIGDIPDTLLNYINWEKWADDFYQCDWTDETVSLYGTEYTFTVRG